jgi:hypothetical protein
MGNPGITNTDHNFVFVAFALDAANNVLARNVIQDISSIVSNESFDLSFNGTLSSTTTPIHRVLIGGQQHTNGDSAEVVQSVSSRFSLTAIEETADIAARPIHVCVFEGLNDTATLNINSTAVLCGVPDSTNVFISSAGGGIPEVYDTNAVEMFLKSISRTLPRAFTTDGHGMVTKSLTALYGDESVDVAFQAMSFDDVQKSMKSIGQMARKLKSDTTTFLETAAPVIGGVGAVASMLPGPAGVAGRRAVSAARMLSR